MVLYGTKQHGTIMLRPTTTACNCRIMYECPINGNCLQTNVIYEATLRYKGKLKKNRIIGIPEGP